LFASGIVHGLNGAARVISWHRLMRGSSVALLVVLALTTAALDARADPTLEVIRTDEALQCPDSAELLELAYQVQGSVASSALHAYRVSFERTSHVYRAEIVDDSAARTRHLEDVGPECAPLGRAVALALATMWGTEQEPTVPPPPVVAAPPPVVSVPPPRPRAPTRWLLSAGGGVALGIVRNAAPALVADSGFEHPHFSWALGGMWVPPQSLPLAPGSIDVQLLAASVRGCGWVLEPTHLGLCARVLGGELLARSSGYDSDGQQSRPWLAFGLEAFVQGPLLPHLRYRAAAAALAPLRDQSFSIQNLGTAYTPPPIGALFTLALELSTP
jgi:hypothetical protein